MPDRAGPGVPGHAYFVFRSSWACPCRAPCRDFLGAGTPRHAQGPPRSITVEKSHNVKLDNRWLGPYRIRGVRDNGSYLLAELDGVELRGSVAGNRLKRFFVRDEDRASR